jgi:hypothetical protein
MITYGPPCFQDGSTRCLEVRPTSVYFKTLYVQGIVPYEGDAADAVLAIFEQYKIKMKRDDKRLFKAYFDQL